MTDLIASDLFDDPRVAEGKRLLLAALREHQAKLTAPRPPAGDRAESYEETLDRFASMRGGSLYYRYLGSGVGNGALVELVDGSVKYDMISGIGVHGLGHSSGLLVEAGIDAALRDTVMQGNLQQNAESVRLSQKLLELAAQSGARLDHCFLSTSGATANENALKIAFQKRHPADRVLAFNDAFAGRTLALAAITDRPKYRDGLPQAINVDYVPFFDARDPKGSTDAAVQVLESHLARYPGRHAVMCLELIQGEGGYWAGDRDFFMRLIDVLRAHDVAVWFDEVQTFARTTRPFAFQHFGLDEHADIVTIGKITQVCATLFNDAFTPRPGLVSQTFTGATSSIFAGIAILDAMTTGGWFGDDGRIMQVHKRFASHLSRIAKSHPGTITDAQGSGHFRGFGFGGMIAFTPFDGSGATVSRVAHALFDAGVISFITGGDTSRVRFLPPVGAITDADIDAVCKIVEETLVKLAAAT